ncbi:class I SAM-dependent methyltransferase [Streptomyces katsurahamanus]|uniref:Class I SAM-dependent methyltransferase n=1 Tax=Streptomyces katsurahamanus TaxID=2577098 RepID=A0ABW9NNU4_9ACTN|nr:class I SAM-dependent methyltransferase [Streptomyces katsurahamanus]MQS34981.1 class I SAM-dependent methyltransferase [Streptomyces katsurahamanus]
MSEGTPGIPGRAERAASFGAAADAYERGRPPYPARAVDWLLAGAGDRVIDLGAGTGKLTRLLTARGLDVTAVEPSDGMREHLAAAAPGARVLAGSAESIPLPDGCADVVTAAQAWHWADTARAVPETARVLAPGGSLALVWNVRDERADWVARLGRLLHPAGARPTAGAGVAALAERPDLYGPTETFTVEWSAELGPAELVDLVASRSYVIMLPEPDRAELLARVRELTVRHPALAGRERFSMPYITRCYRAGRLATGVTSARR